MCQNRGARALAPAPLFSRLVSSRIAASSHEHRDESSLECLWVSAVASREVTRRDASRASCLQSRPRVSGRPRACRGACAPPVRCADATGDVCRDSCGAGARARAADRATRIGSGRGTGRPPPRAGRGLPSGTPSRPRASRSAGLRPRTGERRAEPRAPERSGVRRAPAGAGGGSEKMHISVHEARKVQKICSR